MSAHAARRKRIWARTFISEVLFTTAGGPTPLRVSLTEAYQAARGITMMDPGCTVGGFHVDYSFLQLMTTSANLTTEAAVVWGIIAGGYTVPPATTTNLPPSPLDQPMEDWMWWEHTFFNASAATNRASTSVGPNGRGDGPVIVKSRRKLDELGDDVFLVAEVDPGNFPQAGSEVSCTFSVSALLLLP